MKPQLEVPWVVFGSLWSKACAGIYDDAISKGILISATRDEAGRIFYLAAKHRLSATHYEMAITDIELHECNFDLLGYKVGEMVDKVGSAIAQK